MTVSTHSSDFVRALPLLGALVLGIVACGDGGEQPAEAGDTPTTVAPTTVASLTGAPSADEIAGCLEANGFELELNTEDPVYGIGQIELTIEVPGFAAAGSGTLHVFESEAAATEAFVEISDNAFAPIERHRNVVLDETGSGALNEQGAAEVRSRVEACIGPVSETSETSPG
jgi:hypothetical protein